MSLIGDALRKARQEAADRDADRRGVLFSAKIADGPTRSNLGLGLALGAIIAIAATVIGGGTVWWLLGRSQSTQQVTSSVAAPASTTIVPQTASPDPTDVSPPESESTGHEAHSASPVDASSKPGLEAQSISSDVGRPGSPPIATADQSASSSIESEKQIVGFTGVEDGEEIYIMEADLGRVRLSLDFLVFRGEDPFAEINGIEVHVGGTIEGFRVKAIERDRVRLSDGRRTIVLRAP